MSIIMEAKVRPNAHDGLWCSFLLPIAFLINCLKDHYHYKIQESNIITCILSFGMLFVIFERKYRAFLCQVPQLAVLKHSYLLLVILCTVLLHLWTSYSWCSLLLVTLVTAMLFDYVYYLLLVKCPKSFTFGEASVVAQAIVLFMISCFLSWYNEFHGTRLEYKDTTLETKFLQILLMGCIFLIWIQYMVEQLQSTYPFYIICAVLGTTMYGMWMISLHQDPIMWMAFVCIKNRNRMILMGFWIALTTVSVLFVVYQNKYGKQKASTRSRKYFHIIIILVYLPGVVIDPELLYLASATTLGIFVILELFRILQMPPLGSLLQESFQLFLDEKDSGFLILTHIYLLIGCCCPLWLHTGNFHNASFHISFLSGIISVGFGDTIAAVAGSRFGRHKWPGSEKTVEGTLFAIFAQIIFAVPTLIFSHWCVWWDICILLITIVFTSILEANTTQVDNLILPLFMYPFLCIIQ